jgi:hypothetical protein
LRVERAPSFAIIITRELRQVRSIPGQALEVGSRLGFGSQMKRPASRATVGLRRNVVVRRARRG